jgi:hypothetical protein
MNTKTYIIAVNDNGLEFHKVDASYIAKYQELYDKKIYFIVPIEEFAKKLIGLIK